jgi:hypothetical protein
MPSVASKPRPTTTIGTLNGSARTSPTNGCSRPTYGPSRTKRTIANSRAGPHLTSTSSHEKDDDLVYKASNEALLRQLERNGYKAPEALQSAECVALLGELERRGIKYVLLWAQGPKVAAEMELYSSEFYRANGLRVVTQFALAAAHGALAMQRKGAAAK